MPPVVQKEWLFTATSEGKWVYLTGFHNESMIYDNNDESILSTHSKIPIKMRYRDSVYINMFSPLYIVGLVDE
jgi:hypothetical protein